MAESVELILEESEHVISLYCNGQLIHFSIETVTSFELQMGQRLSYVPDAHGRLRRATCPFDKKHID